MCNNFAKKIIKNNEKKKKFNPLAPTRPQFIYNNIHKLVKKEILHATYITIYWLRELCIVFREKTTTREGYIYRGDERLDC